MKFEMLIARLRTYYEENPSKINCDFKMIAEGLQDKYNEYKRIKKDTFKRQVGTAYECLSKNDDFIKTIETKLEQMPISDESNSDSDIPELKDNNEVNNLITRMYDNKKKTTTNTNTPQPQQAIDNELKDDKKSPVKSNKKRKLFASSTSDSQDPSKRSRRANDLIKSTVNFGSFACDNELIENIFRRIYYILSPNHFLSNGKTPPRGFLLHGPPGCGKTQLVFALAGELDLPLLKVTSTELVSGVSGESEENIRALFDKAIQNVPCILFIDEIEAISQRRENASKDMERRIVTQLLSCFDDLALRPYVPIIVIGATNRPDSLDTALRRASRFDQEIAVGIPDGKQRKKILQILCKNVKLNEDVNIDKIVMNTPGYVGADINSLIDEALISALDRQLVNEIANTKSDDETHKEHVFKLIDWIKGKLKHEENNEEWSNNVESNGFSTSCWVNTQLNQHDFDIAIKRVQPSSKREGFATVPDVTWDDVGALHNVRDEMATAILAPVKYAEQCELFNFTKPPGILLVGPPGCGKTLLAKAIANESGINFISVKGPELLNMYVGESERAVRSVFQRARNSKPCVIFFDEIDAICVKRSDSAGDSGSTTRVVNQMLTEMDGLESRKGVYLMAATNRPDIIDPAILRPGRLDKIIYVGLPTAQDRFEILKTLTKNGTKPKLHEDVNLELVANDERCQTYTGADLSALVRESSEFALKEFIKNPSKENEFVRNRHFEQAFFKIKPSVSAKDCIKYEKMKEMCINLK